MFDALGWYRFGFRVIPLLQGTKSTAVKWAPWLMALSEQAVSAKWAPPATHAVGAITTDRVVMLDADSPASLAALAQLEAEHGIRSNMVFQTPSGRHHWYGRPADVYAAMAGFNTDKHPHKIDIRTTRSGEAGNSMAVLPSPGSGREVLCMPDSIAALVPVTQPFMDAVQAINGRPLVRPYDPSAARKTGPASDTDEVSELLSWVSPDTDYETWLYGGFALHDWAQGAPEGLEKWDEWSASGTNYQPEELAAKYSGFKPREDGIKIATIAKYAQDAGADLSGISAKYRPDISAAFKGETDPDAVATLHADIRQHGCDASKAGELAQSVLAAQSTPAQKEALKSDLLSQWKAARLATPELKAVLYPKAAAAGEYGKNHTENALTYLAAEHAEGTLVMSDEVWYRYTGASWEALTDRHMEHILSVAMLGALPQYSTLIGTRNIIASMVHTAGQRIGDVPGNLILFQNGALDIVTGQLHPHSKDYFTVNILPYDFNLEAKCPQWLHFLSEVFEGDGQRIALVQEWFGYMLSPDNRHQKVMLMVGPTRSGKGTIGRLLKAVVGPWNFSGGGLHDFLSDPFIESLRTKPVLFIGDANKRLGRDAERITECIKKISGSDAMSFSRKYKSTLSETLPTRITVAANSVPRLFDDSGALASRMLMLPFYISYLGKEDLDLSDRLEAEAEGIALWALQGLARLNAAGRFTLPDASVAEKEYLTEAYSPLTRFVDDVCTTGVDGFTSGEELYTAYSAWVVSGREGVAVERKVLTSSVKDITSGRGVRHRRVRVGGARVWGFVGLTLATVPNE
ncbi:MAG: hypothetical protein DRQ65_05580 [Gammaproteobacteria bacterium]|nr:MAG: hypothetical protein DRQ65_05580 [Gammaproteobacteria bacterium]